MLPPHHIYLLNHPLFDVSYVVRWHNYVASHKHDHTASPLAIRTTMRYRLRDYVVFLGEN